jgi:hypothetical protein
MRSDPILNEVYRIKDALAKEVGNDVDKLFLLLREAAQDHPERMVNFMPPKHASTEATKTKP